MASEKVKKILLKNMVVTRLKVEKFKIPAKNCSNRLGTGKKPIHKVVFFENDGNALFFLFQAIYCEIPLKKIFKNIWGVVTSSS